MKNALLRLKQFAEFERNADEQLFMDVFGGKGEWLWDIFIAECECSLTQFYNYLMDCIKTNPNHMNDLTTLNDYFDN